MSMIVDDRRRSSAIVGDFRRSSTRVDDCRRSSTIIDVRRRPSTIVDDFGMDGRKSFRWTDGRKFLRGSGPPWPPLGELCPHRPPNQKITTISSDSPSSKIMRFFFRAKRGENFLRFFFRLIISCGGWTGNTWDYGAELAVREEVAFLFLAEEGQGTHGIMELSWRV